MQLNYIVKPINLAMLTKTLHPNYTEGNVFGIFTYVPNGGLFGEETRQSEMANTSPRHMSMIGNVHPIKIENI